MKINLEEVNQYTNIEKFVTLVTKNVEASLQGSGIDKPEGFEIIFDRNSNEIRISEKFVNTNPLYDVIIAKSVEEILQEIVYKKNSGLIQNKLKDGEENTSKFFNFIFYVINFFAVGSILIWIFNFLNSADFRVWYKSEFLTTDTAFMTFALLIMFPLVVVSSVFGLYLGSKKIFTGGTIERMAFKFEIPALIFLAIGYLFISMPLTPGLRVLFSLLAFVLLGTWFVSILRVRFKNLTAKIINYVLVTTSSLFIFYLLLILVIPVYFFFASVLSPVEIMVFLSDLVAMVTVNPFYIIHIVLFLALLTTPVIVVYLVFKSFIILRKNIKIPEENNKLRLKIDIAVPVMFVALLTVLSYSWSSLEYSDELIILSETDPQASYSTLVNRAKPIIENKKEIEKQLAKEFYKDHYLLKRSNFDYSNKENRYALFYSKVILFPFTDYRQSDHGVNLNAYQNAYKNAFGIEFSQNKQIEIRQVQHLTRDIFVDTLGSDYLSEVTITDSFSTLVNRDQEVVFEFSLPDNAVITNLLLGPALQHKGQIEPRGAAEQVYTEQVRRNIDPALLEQVGPRQYRLRVYPVPTTNKLAASQRGEIVEGEIQRVQFTYIVMREPEGVPLPAFSKNHNILSGETKYTVQLDGKLAQLTDNLTHISDNRSLDELCNLSDEEIIPLLSNRIATLTVGSKINNKNCVVNERLFSEAKGLKIDLLVDTSYLNKDVDLAFFLEELRNLPEKFYSNNDVELMLFSGGRTDQVKKITHPSSIPNLQEIIFVGHSAADIALINIRKDANIVMLFSGLSANGRNIYGKNSYDSAFKDLYEGKLFSIIHTVGKIPSYNQEIINYFSGIKTFSVYDSVTEALRNSVISIEDLERNPDEIHKFGDYWTLNIKDSETEQVLPTDEVMGEGGRDLWMFRYLPTSEGHINERLRKLASKIEINHQNNKNYFPKDYLHIWAASLGIVTPLSSYIALVNQDQQDRMSKLSGDGNRYTSENRFTVTQPSINSPLARTGRGVGLFSTGLNDARSVSGPSTGVRNVSPIVSDVDEKVSMISIIFIILFVIIVVGSAIFIHRKYIQK